MFMSAVTPAHASQEQTRPSILRAVALLTLATLLCLLPFSGRAFQVDDPLFVWTARQIVEHPLDPYGFSLNWGITRMRMAEVTQNPPLAAYYGALIGRVAGWSERAWHLGFLLPALVVVLGTYRLARRFTRLPLVAAAATLLTPGFLVCSTSVMSDSLMLALWILAAIFWLEGLEPVRPLYLVASAVLMAACALTKYFGASLIPLLLVYSVARQRRLGKYAWYLLIPILILVGYQLWTKAVYGHGLLFGATEFARIHREQSTKSVKAAMGLSFVGGCMLPALTIAPFLWSRKRIFWVSVVAALAGFFIGTGWVSLGISPQAHAIRFALRQHSPSASIQLALCIAGGIFVLALATADFRKRKDAESLFLMLWVLGTFIFAAFLNWTLNARSVLPLIPATGILLARRMQEVGRFSEPRFLWKLILALTLSGAVSLWITSADAALANSARTAADLIHKRTQNEAGAVWFEGHWGFQYCMELYAARAVDFENSTFNPGDFVVIPENNAVIPKMLPLEVAALEVVEVKLSQPITTIRRDMGAGFYSTYFGPLPFAVGKVPPERYYVFRLISKVSASQLTPPTR
jgi:4-amino-4-deoxy-L-arabinose transferase-like glycosyltransferase